MALTQVKICGLTTTEDVAAAVSAGATYLGFNFFPKSPRYVSIETATKLASDVPAGVCKVALTVDASDAELLQLAAALDPIGRKAATELKDSEVEKTEDSFGEDNSPSGLVDEAIFVGTDQTSDVFSVVGMDEVLGSG